MTRATNVERLRAAGGYEGDWGDPSTYAPESVGFAGTGAVNSKTHLAEIGAVHQMTAICGVGIAGTPSEQTLDVILNGENGNPGLCRRCLLVLERER